MDKDELLANVIVLGGMGAVIVAIIIACHFSDTLSWNGGYHKCGGKWNYVQPVGHAYSTDYLYECDGCGKTHEFMRKR